MRAIVPEDYETEYSFRFHKWGNGLTWISRSNVAWTSGVNDVNFNIPGIERAAASHSISFEVMFSHCASHEIIHNILMRYENEAVYRAFDNICFRKNKNFKEWFGGMA